MIRTSVLALASVVGLAGATEFSGNQASAASFFRVGIGIGIPAPVVYRPVYRAPVVYAPPVVVYTPPPAVVVAAPPAYEVVYRTCPTASLQVYGCYPSRVQAYEAVGSLQGQGYRAFVAPR
jgi:hypothetical protein